MRSVHRDWRAGSVNDDEPIFVLCNVETAKHFAPAKLLLPVKVGTDDTFVECLSFGIVDGIVTVKGV
jgi:hypothetical protein